MNNTNIMNNIYEYNNNESLPNSLKSLQQTSHTYK